MSDNKIPLVVFSGGVDSTYLLHEQLLEGDVDTVYIRGCQGSNKIRSELKAREAVFEYLANEHIVGRLKGKVRKDTELKIDVEGDEISSPGIREQRSYWTSDWHGRSNGFNQPMFWLSGINWIFDPRKHSKILMGYISGDQFLYHLQDLSKAWDVISSFTHLESAPLEFPLKFRTKFNIVDRMRKQLFDLTWVCEGQASKECGHCEKCLEKKAISIRVFGEPVTSMEEKREIGHQQEAEGLGIAAVIADDGNQQSDQREEGDYPP